MSPTRKPSLLGQTGALLLAFGLVFGMALLVVRSVQQLLLADTADQALLVGFEVFLFILFSGTLALVLLGLCLRMLLPAQFAEKAYGFARIQEIYEAERLDHFSVESAEGEAHNPYHKIADLELCDVAQVVDREAHPEVWEQVAHEIKTRVERCEPVRIG